MNDPSFQGRGWGYPLQLDSDQRVKLTQGVENIRQSIWIILSTAKGERQMRPDFGCGIHDLVFGLNQASTAGQVAAEVREALVIWEPRIDIIAVTARPDEAQPTRLNMEINSEVRATNSRFNMVYPFYLE